MERALEREDCDTFVWRSESDRTAEIRTAALQNFRLWLDADGYSWRDIDWTACVALQNPHGEIITHGPIDRQMIEAFLAELVQQGRSPKVVATHLYVVRTFFEALVENGVLKLNPADGIRGPRLTVKQPYVPTTQDLESFFAALRHRRTGERDFTFAYVLSWGGYRGGELLSLQVDDIVAEERTIRLYNTKKRKYEVRAIATPALRALERWIESPGREQSSWVFPGKTSDGHLSYRTMQGIFKDTAIAAGLAAKVKGLHSLRRAFATSLLEDGMAAQAVSQALGHARPESLFSYATAQARRKIGRDVLRRSRFVRLWDTGEIPPLPD